MPRGIDHLVIAVDALDRARERYEQLGFTLTPKARHPFGTENSLVQLEGCFLELLGVVAPDEFPEPVPGAFSFPQFNARFLDRHQGFSMLVLDSHDADRDRVEFAKAGLQSYLPFQFGRDAKQPDGSVAHVGFKLAFASDPYAPETGYFTCQQLAPEFFWKPDYQRHANTARTISEVVMISATPSNHRRFFEGFAGTRDIRATETGILIQTARGAIRVEEPRAVAEIWGAAVDLSAYDTPRFAAYVIGVGDLEKAVSVLEGAGVEHFALQGRVIVPASDTFGVAIAFETVGS